MHRRLVFSTAATPACEELLVSDRRADVETRKKPAYHGTYVHDIPVFVIVDV